MSSSSSDQQKLVMDFQQLPSAGICLTTGGGDTHYLVTQDRRIHGWHMDHQKWSDLGSEDTLWMSVSHDWHAWRIYRPSSYDAGLDAKRGGDEDSLAQQIKKGGVLQCALPGIYGWISVGIDGCSRVSVGAAGRVAVLMANGDVLVLDERQRAIWNNFHSKHKQRMKALRVSDSSSPAGSPELRSRTSRNREEGDSFISATTVNSQGWNERAKTSVSSAQFLHSMKQEVKDTEARAELVSLIHKFTADRVSRSDANVVGRRLLATDHPQLYGEYQSLLDRLATDDAERTVTMKNLRISTEEMDGSQRGVDMWVVEPLTCRNADGRKSMRRSNSDGVKFHSSIYRNGRKIDYHESRRSDNRSSRSASVMRRRTASLSHPTRRHPAGLLEVVVLAGNDLTDCDAFGDQDPFVRVVTSEGGASYRTPVNEGGGQNPVFADRKAVVNSFKSIYRQRNRRAREEKALYDHSEPSSADGDEKDQSGPSVLPKPASQGARDTDDAKQALLTQTECLPILPDSSFQFDLSVILPQAAGGRDANIVFECWDKDQFKNDLIGTGKLGWDALCQALKQQYDGLVRLAAGSRERRKPRYYDGRRYSKRNSNDDEEDKNEGGLRIRAVYHKGLVVTIPLHSRKGKSTGSLDVFVGLSLPRSYHFYESGHSATVDEQLVRGLVTAGMCGTGLEGLLLRCRAITAERLFRSLGCEQVQQSDMSLVQSGASSRGGTQRNTERLTVLDKDGNELWRELEFDAVTRSYTLEWNHVGQSARSVSIGADGAVWAVTRDGIPTRFTAGVWVPVPVHGQSGLSKAERLAARQRAIRAMRRRGQRGRPEKDGGGKHTTITQVTAGSTRNHHVYALAQDSRLFRWRGGSQWQEVTALFSGRIGSKASLFEGEDLIASLRKGDVKHGADKSQIRSLMRRFGLSGGLGGRGRGAAGLVSVDCAPDGTLVVLTNLGLALIHYPFGFGVPTGRLAQYGGAGLSGVDKGGVTGRGSRGFADEEKNVDEMLYLYQSGADEDAYILDELYNEADYQDEAEGVGGLRSDDPRVVPKFQPTPEFQTRQLGTSRPGSAKEDEDDLYLDEETGDDIYSQIQEQNSKKMQSEWGEYVYGKYLSDKPNEQVNKPEVKRRATGSPPPQRLPSVKTLMPEFLRPTSYGQSKRQHYRFRQGEKQIDFRQSLDRNPFAHINDPFAFASQRNRANLLRLFRRYDVNQSGYIGRHEMMLLARDVLGYLYTALPVAIYKKYADLAQRRKSSAHRMFYDNQLHTKYGDKQQSQETDQPVYHPGREARLMQFIIGRQTAKEIGKKIYAACDSDDNDEISRYEFITGFCSVYEKEVLGRFMKLRAKKRTYVLDMEAQRRARRLEMEERARKNASDDSDQKGSRKSRKGRSGDSDGPKGNARAALVRQLKLQKARERRQAALGGGLTEMERRARRSRLKDERALRRERARAERRRKLVAEF